MKGKHLNEMDAFCLFAHKKIICAFVVLAIALLLVPGIVFATENKGEAPANTKTLTITLTESDKTTPITNSPYVFVAGLNNTLTELTWSTNFITDNTEGVFTINSIPDDVETVAILAGAKNHENRGSNAMFSGSSEASVKISLNAADTCSFIHDTGIKSVKILSTSYIQLAFSQLNLPETVMDNSFFPDFWDNNGDWPYLETSTGGLINYVFGVGNLAFHFNFQVETLSGYHFQEWNNTVYNETGQDAAGSLKTIDPIIAKDGEVVIYGTLHAHRSEPFDENSHPYVACVGVRNSILDPVFYIGDIVNIPVIVGESYLPYRISVPNDFVIGSLAFGGNQFKNHAVVVDPYISTKVDTEIDPGRTFTIEHSEGFHHVALKAGSKFHAELIGYEIMDYTLEEDISFYGMGLPYYGFNATQVDPVSFNDDGTVNFTFEEEQTDVYSINAEINLETVADDGYAFDKWVIEKYDDPGNELIPVYDVKKITPTFTKIPQPAPTPEEPEYVNGQTGDNVPLMTIVLLAVVTIACFGVWRIRKKIQTTS